MAQGDSEQGSVNSVTGSQMLLNVFCEERPVVG